MCRMRGTYLEVGHISPNSLATFDVQKLVSNQMRFNAIQHYDPWIIPNSIDFLMRTRDKYPALTNVISHQYPIDKIDEAFATAEWLGREGGSVVTRAIVCAVERLRSPSKLRMPPLGRGFGGVPHVQCGNHAIQTLPITHTEIPRKTKGSGPIGPLPCCACLCC